MCCYALLQLAVHVSLVNCFAGMISFEQWRAAIGSFQVVITCRCPTEHHDVGVYAKRIFVLSALWCSFIVCTVCLYNVTKILVICSNDVKLNPGPVIYRVCPNCRNKAVHTKKKSCPCGHIFLAKLVRAVQLQILMVLLIITILLHLLALVCAIKTNVLLLQIHHQKVITLL